jgi:hypothetical protein
MIVNLVTVNCTFESGNKEMITSSALTQQKSKNEVVVRIITIVSVEGGTWKQKGLGKS